MDLWNDTPTAIILTTFLLIFKKNKIFFVNNRKCNLRKNVGGTV
jgi:hypothetical protein